MSTLATADLGPSDDEADDDFVPSGPKPKRPKGKGGKRPRSGSQSSSGSGSSDDDGDDDDVNDEVKRLRAEREEALAAERKQRAADAFRAMQEEARTPAPKVDSPAANKDEVEMVEVKRPRRFAGETIYETVRLPKGDPEAIKYLAQQAAEAKPQETAPTPQAAETSAAAPEPTATTISSADASIAPSTAIAAPIAAPPRRGPPMRKRPRQSLEAMAAAIDKGKKMTTLEKSQMDWNSHMATETKLADEVAQHRRGGGYLEKQAFLERVGERRSMGPGGGSTSTSRRG